MQDITLGPFDDSRFVSDTGAFSSFFECLTVLRSAHDKIYSMSQKLTWMLLVSLCGQRSVLVAIDGKTVHDTIPTGESNGLHLLAAHTVRQLTSVPDSLAASCPVGPLIGLCQRAAYLAL